MIKIFYSLCIASLFFVTAVFGSDFVKPGIKYTPELGQIKEADNGALMIEIREGELYTAFSFTEDCIPPANVANTNIEKTAFKNSVWVVRGKLSNGDLISEPFAQMDGYRMQINSEGSIVGFFKRMTDTPQLLCTKSNIVSRDDNYFRPTHLSQQFIYNGKVGNVVRIIYRELWNDLVRPAFTQDLSYDLSESNILRFRGMKIEVIKATGSFIKFKILAPVAQS